MQKILKFMSSWTRNSDYVLKNSCLFCIRIRIINTLKTEAARVSEMFIFKYKILRFPTQKNIKDMKVRRSFFNLVKANCNFDLISLLTLYLKRLSLLLWDARPYILHANLVIACGTTSNQFL